MGPVNDLREHSVLNDTTLYLQHLVADPRGRQFTVVNIIESDLLNAKVEQGSFDALLSVDVLPGRLREPILLAIEHCDFSDYLARADVVENDLTA